MNRRREMVFVIKRGLFFTGFLLWIGGIAFSADFGLVLAPAAEYTSDTGGEGVGFTGSVTPWFSAAFGERAGLYASGKVTFEYPYHSHTWNTPPLLELERTELNFRPAQAVYISLGRHQYRDNGGTILSGLFDGVSLTIGFSRARLLLGAFYTGLLYKETAKILITGTDRSRYARPLDYGDGDSYFASRRILVPLALEFPDVSSRLTLAVTVLAQFDVNGASDDLHTQYLEAVVGIEAADTLRVTVTGVGGAAENTITDVKFHAAGAVGADWDVPGTLPDMVHGELRWGSGAISETIVPFIPVTGIAQGTVCTPTLQGLLNARASYTARLHRTVSVSAGAVVFWRTDTETFTDAELDGASGERYVGVEASGSVVWAPQSALRVTAGGGVFFPGGAFRDDAGIRWKLSGGISLSL
jgi:hypothetical protein